jgi:hypothetical protein
MANFPTSKDSFTTKVDNVDSVVASHINTLQEIVVALEDKVGITSSADSASLDYFASHASGRFRTHDHSGGIYGAPIPSSSLSGVVDTTNAQDVGGIKTFTSIPVLPATDPTSSNEATRKSYVDSVKIKTLIWFISGAGAVGTNVSARLKVNFAGTITKAKAYAKTAPVGSNLIFDINKSGTSIWASTQANRVKVTAGANEDTDQTNFDTSTFSADDIFTVDIDGVGSSTAGSDITVMLEVTY